MHPETQTLLTRLRALADPARLRLVALCRQGECSVSELTAVLAQSQPRISQHLKQLVEAGLIERFRDGKRGYYRTPAVPRGSLNQLLALLPEGDPALAPDAAALRRLRGSAPLEAVPAAGAAETDPALHRALVDLTVPAPLGDFPPLPCGSGPLEAVPAAGAAETDRALHRALLDLTITAPLGDFIDVGCGSGRLLKLLASRAHRAVGVDIDAGARQLARAQVLLAGLPNVT